MVDLAGHAAVAVVRGEQTTSAVGTNGYVSSWGEPQAGCPRPGR